MYSTLGVLFIEVGMVDDIVKVGVGRLIVISVLALTFVGSAHAQEVNGNRFDADSIERTAYVMKTSGFSVNSKGLVRMHFIPNSDGTYRALLRMDDMGSTAILNQEGCEDYVDEKGRYAPVILCKDEALSLPGGFEYKLASGSVSGSDFWGVVNTSGNFPSLGGYSLRLPDPVQLDTFNYRAEINGNLVRLQTKVDEVCWVGGVGGAKSALGNLARKECRNAKVALIQSQAAGAKIKADASGVKADASGEAYALVKQKGNAAKIKADASGVKADASEAALRQKLGLD